MNLSDVMDDIGQALKTIEGLRVFPYNVERVASPAAVVGWPETIEYDAGMGRGADRMTLVVFLLVASPQQRSARDQLARYLNGGGPESVKAAIDGGTYTALDSARVMRARVDTLTSAGTDYLGAVLDVDIIGRGA